MKFDNTALKNKYSNYKDFIVEEMCNRFKKELSEFVSSLNKGFLSQKISVTLQDLYEDLVLPNKDYIIENCQKKILDICLEFGLPEPNLLNLYFNNMSIGTFEITSYTFYADIYFSVSSLIGD